MFLFQYCSWLYSALCQQPLTPPPKLTDSRPRQSRYRRTSLTNSTANQRAGILKPRPCWPGTWTGRGRARWRAAGGRGVWLWHHQGIPECFDTDPSATARSHSNPNAGTESWCVRRETLPEERVTTPPSRSTSSVSLTRSRDEAARRKDQRKYMMEQVYEWSLC